MDFYFTIVVHDVYNGTLHQGERGRIDIYARVTWSIRIRAIKTILSLGAEYYPYHSDIKVNMPSSALQYYTIII